MARALYPGSFDPVHLGHMDVIEQVAAQYGEVIVAAVGNPAKAAFLSLSDRVLLLQHSVRHLSNVDVTSHGGLVADLARSLGVEVIVRAAGKEAKNEIVMARTNLTISGIKTVFVVPSGPTAFIGSRSIRELVRAGRGDQVHTLVPPGVADRLAAMELA